MIADLSGGKFTDFAVISFSEIEAISLKIGDQTAEIDKNGFVINGGNLGGLIKINELTNKLNNLVRAFNSHVHPVTAVGTPTGIIAMPAQSFRSADYENKPGTNIIQIL